MGSDMEEMQEGMVMTVEQPRRQVKVAGVVGLVAAVLLCVGVVARSGAPARDNSALKEYYSQLDEIVVQPPREKCSKIGANCVSTKCCKISGYNCFEKTAGSASCMKSCIPGVNGTCLMPGSIVPLKPAVGVPGTTLFCFTFYMEDTGSTKKFYDLSLLRTNLFLGSSLFGCEAYKVYGDVETWLSPGQVSTVKVDDVNGDFHFAKRKLTGTWVNSPMFIQAWKAIRTEGVWASHDWTVKVDADAVFLRMRLRTKLSSQKDLFMQRCMDLHGVDKVSVWDLTTDSMCKAFRPEGQKKNEKWRPNCALTTTAAMHPFMKPYDYFECLKATQR